MSETELSLEIITPNGIKFKDDIKVVTVPGTQGSFQVLKDHAPLISTVEIGEVKIEKLDDEVIYFATSGGTFEVLKNNVMLLVDTIEPVDEIDVERASDAKKRAEERLAKKDDKSIDLTRAEIALRKAKNRLKVVKERKKADINV